MANPITTGDLVTLLQQEQAKIGIPDYMPVIFGVKNSPHTTYTTLPAANGKQFKTLGIIPQPMVESGSNDQFIAPAVFGLPISIGIFIANLRGLDSTKPIGYRSSFRSKPDLISDEKMLITNELSHASILANIV